jgi:hypothetical protein
MARECRLRLRCRVCWCGEPEVPENLLPPKIAAREFAVTKPGCGNDGLWKARERGYYFPSSLKPGQKRDGPQAIGKELLDLAEQHESQKSHE